MTRKLALSLVGGTAAATTIIVPSVLLTTNRGGEKVTAETLKNDWNALSKTGSLAVEGLSNVSANKISNWNDLVFKIINDTKKSENTKLREFINKAKTSSAIFDGSVFIALENSLSVKLKIKIGDSAAVETKTLILTGFASLPTPDPIPPTPSGVLTKEIADKLVAYKKFKNENTLYEKDLKGFSSIGDYAFQNNDYFVSVEIPNSITTIAQMAFSNCSALKSITIPNSIVKIGESAFSGCSALSSISIPNSEATIGNFAFANCSMLSSVSLNYKHFDNLKNIGFNQQQIAKIKWEWTGDFPKTEAKNLTKELAKQITNYKKLVKKSTDLTANDLAGFTSIDSSAFANNKHFKSLEIPSNIQNIGPNAFSSSSISSINIISSINSIGAGAFSNCTLLTKINIPQKINIAGKNAFSGCSNLKTIVLNIKNFQDFKTLGFTDKQKDLVKWKGGSIMPKPSGALTSEKVQEIRKYKEEIEKSTALTSQDLSGYTSIADSAFASDRYFTSIEIPNSVTSIGNYSFSNCMNLKTINIPNSVNSIGTSAFDNSSISSITIASGLKSIGDYAFSNCSKLKTINIPNSVNSIGVGVFYNCTSLTKINISNSVASIGNYLFYGCSSLESITLPSSITSIGFFAFAECSKLGSINIPEKVKSIGTNAFYNCSALKTLSIAQSVTDIGNNAFANCSSLNSVKIPSRFNDKEKLFYIGLQVNSKNIEFT